MKSSATSTLTYQSVSGSATSASSSRKGRRKKKRKSKFARFSRRKKQKSCNVETLKALKPKKEEEGDARNEIEVKEDVSIHNRKKDVTIKKEDDFF